MLTSERSTASEPGVSVTTAHNAEKVTKPCGGGCGKQVTAPRWQFSATKVCCVGCVVRIINR